MFFRTNISQVKLDNISFLLTWRQTNHQTIKFFQLYLKNSKGNKSKYMKHRKHALRGFLQNRFYDTLTLADFLGKNWYRPTTLL